MKVKLKEDQPISFHGTITFMKKGEEFEVLEEKTDPLGDLFYVVKETRFNLVADGMTKANCFEVIEDDKGNI